MRELMRQTKANLVRACEARDLPAGGTKADLAARILADREDDLVLVELEVEYGFFADDLLLPSRGKNGKD